MDPSAMTMVSSCVQFFQVKLYTFAQNNKIFFQNFAFILLQVV